MRFGSTRGGREAKITRTGIVHSKRRFDPTFRISVRLLMLLPNEASTYDDYRVYA
jgi:hypothetical protein